MPHESQLQSIYAKLQKLAKEHEQLKKEHAKLKGELEKKQHLNTGLQQKEEQLQHQLAILKTTGKPLEESGKKELVKRIDQYIKHIDKTISILNE